MIAHGVLGQLTFMEAAYNYGRLHKITDGWRGQLDFYSVVHGGAVHMIDLLLWLTGDRIVEVTARGNAIASSGSSFANHDLVTSIAQFESGALANVTANSGCVHPHFHVLNIYGTEATFQNDVPHARLVHSRDPNEPPRSIETEYPGAHKGDLIRGFVDSIVGDMPAEVTAEDVFATMSVSLAIEQASHQSQAVAVQYI